MRLLKRCFGILSIVLIHSSHAASTKCVDPNTLSTETKNWVEKLSSFENPVETKSHTKSIMIAYGATRSKSENKIEPKTKIPFEWNGKTTSIERHLLDASLLKTVLSKKPKADIVEAFAKKYKSFTDVILSEDEKKYLKDCSENQKKCKIKFNEDELSYIFRGRSSYVNEGSPFLVENLNPEQRFFTMLIGRIRGFAQRGEIRGYEGTSRGSDPEPTRPFQHTLTREDQMQWPGPLEDQAAFFNAAPTAGSKLKLFFEVFNPEPSKFKPVVALFAQECTVKNSLSLCKESVIYNNHYFDYWARVWFEIPVCGEKTGRVRIMAEVMDIDQLKDGSLLSSLMATQMRNLVARVLESRLKALNVIVPQG